MIVKKKNSGKKTKEYKEDGRKGGLRGKDGVTVGSTNGRGLVVRCLLLKSI